MVVDAVGDNGGLGLISAVVLDVSGNPVIAYSHGSNRELRLVRCNDPDCVSGDDNPVVIDSSSFLDRPTSLLLDASDNPVIAYCNTSGGDLRLVHCNDPGCSGVDDLPETVDAVGRTGLHASLALDQLGNP